MTCQKLMSRNENYFLEILIESNILIYEHQKAI
jgi:hypothetical protein